MKLYCTIILIFLSLLSGAQGGFRSRIYLPGVTNHFTKAVFETSPGNYIAAGFSEDTLDGYPNNRLTIMGLDSLGKLKWVKKYGDKNLFYNNNIFVIRTFYKQGSHLYYAGCVRDSTNKQIGVLIKFDLNGDTVWQKIYRDPDPLEDVIPQMVTGSVDGGFLITGFFQHWGLNYRKCMLIKTDAHGNELWRKKIGKVAPDVQDGKAIVQDSISKRVVIVGYQYAKPGESTAYDNILILDSLGEKVSQYSQYTYNFGVAQDLILTSRKTHFIVGFNITKKDANTNYYTAFITKFNSNSAVPKIWNKLYPPKALGAGFCCIREMPNGDILAAGVLDSSALLTGIENSCLRFTRIDTAGNILSNKYYNYKKNSPDTKNLQSVASLELTSDGGWIVAVAQQNYPYPNPFFFVKYDSTGCDSTTAYCRSRDSLILLGVAGDQARNKPGTITVNVFPNPTKGDLVIEYKNPDNENATVIIRDALGRIIFREKIKSGNFNTTFSIDTQPSGLYFISIDNQSGGFYYKGKVMKN